jgi:hypothetical protein
MMKKRLIGTTILFLILLLVFSLHWDNKLHEQEDLRMPVSLGSYSGYGDYKINPQTILISLELGNTNVFEPLLEDPRDVEELTDISISWTQADFMRIFSALSKFVWDDAMDPKVWNIYAIHFSGGCIDEDCELFHYARIIYFTKTGNSYTTRFIDIQPYFGLVRWGDGASYRQPILHKWKGVDLAASKVSAENALKIAEENGGKERRLKVYDRCPVYIDATRFNPENWDVSCIPGLYTFLIDLDTGESRPVGH